MNHIFYWHSNEPRKKNYFALWAKINLLCPKLKVKGKIISGYIKYKHLAYAFELWCWRRVLRIHWTARQTNKSVIETMKPKLSLEAMIIKRQLSYFGHIMRKTTSLENSIMLGKCEGKRRRGRQRRCPQEWTSTRWHRERERERAYEPYTAVSNGEKNRKVGQVNKELWIGLSGEERLTSVITPIRGVKILGLISARWRDKETMEMVSTDAGFSLRSTRGGLQRRTYVNWWFNLPEPLKDESGKNTINLTELEQSRSCSLTPRLTQSV